jgi:hypothetical protein
MNSQRAEVMWFLTPMKDSGGAQLTAGPGQAPLYSLHRRQRLIVTDNHSLLNSVVNPVLASVIPQLQEIAVRPDLLNLNLAFFPTLKDYVHPHLRTMMDATGARSVPSPLTGAQAGEDRMIGDVLSFEVKLLMEGDYQFKTVWQIQQEARGKYAAQDFPGGEGIFDTANWPIHDPKYNGKAGGNGNGLALGLNNNNLTVTVKAVEVVIRVWDHKTEQVRQITVVQDL